MMKYLETISNIIGTHLLETLLVCFIGAFLAYYFNIKANKRKLAQEAFKEFERVFTPARHLLDDPRQTSYVVVADEFSKHQSAMLDFEHILQGGAKDRFKEKWTEYLNKCDKIRQYGYNIFLGEETGPPSIGILEHIRDRQGHLIEIESDKANKQELKRIIKELIEIARY